MHDHEHDPYEEPEDSSGGEEFSQPLPPEERESVEADLQDLEAIRSVFQSQGARGVVIACTECGANHFYDWDLLKESLEHMLRTGEPRMHEPAFEPREDEYVVWDYGKGYVDALSDTGLEAGTKIDLTSCGWCGGALEAQFAFCPKCGRPTAVMRLYQLLLERGVEAQEARSLLIRAGFEPFG